MCELIRVEATRRYMGDTDDDRSSRGDAVPPGAIPVGAIPDPVVGYDRRDGDLVISRTNAAFDDAFGGSPDRPVGRWLREDLRADGATVEEVRTSLEADREVDVMIEAPPDEGRTAERYRMRSLGAFGDDAAVGGYCLLTELDPPGARGADVDVDSIAGAVSHDLRNPLDVANAHLRAARETGDEEHFDQVEAAHDRMEGIIQDVLTLARGEGALDVVADVDVGAVAEDAWATVDTGGASLSVADDLRSVEADPDRVQRLFENLFRNSVEHARPNGGPGDSEVHVRVGSTDGGFFVADDGVGVPSPDRDRVFDPGYSAGEASNGTGLGLTIVETIATAHGWTVTVTDGSDGGARFELRDVECVR